MTDNALYKLINAQVLAVLVDEKNKVRMRQAMRVLKRYGLALAFDVKKGERVRFIDEPGSEKRRV